MERIFLEQSIKFIINSQQHHRRLSTLLMTDKQPGIQLELPTVRRQESSIVFAHNDVLPTVKWQEIITEQRMTTNNDTSAPIVDRQPEILESTGLEPAPRPPPPRQRQLGDVLEFGSFCLHALFCAQGTIFSWSIFEEPVSGALRALICDLGVLMFLPRLACIADFFSDKWQEYITNLHHLVVIGLLVVEIYGHGGYGK